MVVFKRRILRRIFLFAVVTQLTAGVPLYGQHTTTPPEKDSTTLAHSLKHLGAFQGHIRSFFMATDNASPMTDAAALAFGAGISYESPRIHGFQLGLAGFFIFNLGSTDLGKRDSLSNAYNRYEIGLFDLSNAGNKKDLDRLEDLYLKYHFRSSRLEAGRFELNTPFINRQDGRMRGTIEEGVWMEMNEIRKLRVEAGWIWKISPRSTVAWYEVEKSYGVYPSGVSETGVKSSYAGHIRSEGVGLLGLSWSPAKNVQFQFWEQYAENVFNTALFRSDWKVPVSPDVHLISGLMVVRQDALNDGGNPDPAKAYIRKGSRAQVFSGRAGAGIRKFEFTFNYTRILDDGRFLMPREWGREPFYTFMPRERNEGFADVHAVNVSAGASLLNGRLKPSLSYGHFYLPDVKDAKRNKYGMPAYRQLNAEVRYAFSGYLKGMALQFLMVYKGEMGETYGEYRYVFNKVNMLNWNVMVDYKF